MRLYSAIIAGTNGSSAASRPDSPDRNSESTNRLLRVGARS